MDKDTLEQMDVVFDFDDKSSPVSPEDISTSPPQSTESDSLFCLRCGNEADDMKEPASWILDDDSCAFCSQKCADEFDKEVQARIMMERTQKEQKQQQQVQPGTTPTPTRTGRKSRQSQATNAQSVRTVSRERVVHELRRTYSSTQNSEKPYDLKRELSSFAEALRADYTAKQAHAKVDLFLQFILLTTEICPRDHTSKIRGWGRMKQATFAEQLGYFASQRNVTSQAWGKTVDRLLTLLAQKIWPRTAKDRTNIKKNRSWYGFRFNGYGDVSSIPTADHDRHIDINSPQSLSSTPVSTPGSSDSGCSLASPFTSPRIMTPFFTPLTRTSRSKMQFQPYYDILENGDCYVVRIFTPAMTPQDANKLQITSNLAQKYVSVTGAYIPGCIIGDQLVNEFDIQKPLTSSICSQTKNSGYMDLKIALPTDIKDDEQSIQFAHVMWGLAIHFPRRKQVQDVTMRFTSCFGTCNLDVEHKSSPTNGQQKSSDDDDVDDVDTTTPQENKATGKTLTRTRRTATKKTITTKATENSKRNTRLRRTTNKKRKVRSPSPATTPKATRKRKTPGREKTITKQDLIGRTCSVRGELWDDSYAGQYYDMTVLRIVKTIKPGDTKKYDTFILEEDDHEYEFYLHDLKDFGIVTEEEYHAMATDADPYVNGRE